MQVKHKIWATIDNGPCLSIFTIALDPFLWARGPMVVLYSFQLLADGHPNGAWDGHPFVTQDCIDRPHDQPRPVILIQFDHEPCITI